MQALYDGKFVYRLADANVSCEVVNSGGAAAGEAAARYCCSGCRLEVQVVAGQGVPWCCARPMEASRSSPGLQ